MSLVKFAFWRYSVDFSGELETGDRTILIITFTSFYTFNHHMPENCDGKTLWKKRNFLARAGRIWKFLEK